MQRALDEILGPKGLVGRFCHKWESMLNKTQGQGPFFLGDRPSIADIGVFEALDNFQAVFGNARFEQIFEPFPAVMRCFAATRALGKLAEYCDTTRQSYDTWDSAAQAHTRWEVYAISVRTTLE